MHYYLIIALKVFCFYHIYKNHKTYYWYFVVIFIPVAGGIFYIITQVLSGGDVDKIQNELTTIINPTKKVKDLERKIQFTDTYQNRIDLADAYFEIRAYKNAIVNYEKTLEDTVQNPEHSIKHLIQCYFEIEDYDKVIRYADKIKYLPEFKGSSSQFCYGLALQATGEIEKAEEELRQIDRPYSNYNERLQLAKFYLSHNKTEEGKTLLEEIYNESQYMTKTNRRLFRSTINEVIQLLKTV